MKSPYFDWSSGFIRLLFATAHVICFSMMFDTCYSSYRRFWHKRGLWSFSIVLFQNGFFFPQGGKFNIVPLLVNVGSGLALLGIVSWLGCFCIELIGLDHASFDHKWFVNMMEVLTRQFRIFVCDYLGICCKITIAKADFVNHSCLTWNCTRTSQTEKWNRF